MTTNSALWLGCAKVEITPEKPMVMGGYGNRLDKSKGTHDPLFARAIYLYDGKKSALIVVCDLVAVGDDLTEILRAELLQKVGVDKANIMISATHTQAGPAAVRNLLDPEYTAHLIAMVCKAGANAIANKQQVSLKLLRAIILFLWQRATIVFEPPISTAKLRESSLFKVIPPEELFLA